MKDFEIITMSKKLADVVHDYIDTRERGMAFLLTTHQWAILRAQAIDYLANFLALTDNEERSRELRYASHGHLIELIYGKGLCINHDGFDDDPGVMVNSGYMSVVVGGANTKFDFLQETMYFHSQDQIDLVGFDLTIGNEVHKPLFDLVNDNVQKQEVGEFLRDFIHSQLVSVINRLSPNLVKWIGNTVPTHLSIVLIPLIAYRRYAWFLGPDNFTLYDEVQDGIYMPSIDIFFKYIYGASLEECKRLFKEK